MTESAAGAAAVLTGSACPKCGAPAFPARALCGACGAGDQVSLPLPPTGHVYVSTVLHIRPPAGFPSPYAVGYVKLAGLPLVIPACFGACAAPLPRGTPVELVAVAPWYAAASGGPPVAVAATPTGPGYLFRPRAGDRS